MLKLQRKVESAANSVTIVESANEGAERVMADANEVDNSGVESAVEGANERAEIGMTDASEDAKEVVVENGVGEERASDSIVESVDNIVTVVESTKVIAGANEEENEVVDRSAMGVEGAGGHTESAMTDVAGASASANLNGIEGNFVQGWN